MRRTRMACVVGLLASLTPASTRGDAREECAMSYEQAQRLRHAGKLIAARVELTKCARDVCPHFVHAGCAQWLGEVEHAIPSVVVTAKDGRGNDTDAVSVAIDGAVVAGRLDGRAIELDPGGHDLVCEWSGRSIARRIVVSEGATNRQVAVDFSTLERAPENPAPHPSEKPAPPVSHGIPAASIVLGGVALVAVGSFAFFGLEGKAKEGCVPNCTNADVDTYQREFLIADISLGIALASAAAALWIGLSSHDDPPKSTASVRFGVSPGPGGATAAATVSF